MALDIVDCSYMERRRSQSADSALEQYHRWLQTLGPIIAPLPVVLEYRLVDDEAHGYGFYQQALYLDARLLEISPERLLLEGLELTWDGQIITSALKRWPTLTPTTRVFVRQSACRCPDRSLDCELLTVKQYLQKTGHVLTRQAYLKVCRQAGAAYRQHYGENAPDLPELGSRAKQLWVRHYPPAAWPFIEAAVSANE